jgi:hypothetical protein
MEVWIEFWSIEFDWDRSSGLARKFFSQEKKIPMAPGKVDPNKKQARSSNDKDGEHLFFIDRMANTVSGPSQAPIHLAELSPRD